VAEALDRADDVEQLRTLIDSVPNLAWAARADGWIEFYNRRWYEYTGTTPAQMEGWGWQSVHDPVELPRVLERWQASIATGQPFEMVFPLRGADGVLRWHLTRVAPVRDALGQVTRWVGTNTDIDAQQRTEQALAEALDLTATLNRIGAVLSEGLELDHLVHRITDEATALCRAELGAFYYAGEVATASSESFTLYAVAGATGAASSKTPVPRDACGFAPTFRGEGVIRIDDVTKDPRFGERFTLAGLAEEHLCVASYLAVPVKTRGGEVVGALAFGHSRVAAFTSRDETLVVAVAGQAGAAIENARLYEAARVARSEAEAASRAKDEFLAMLGHELRNPLAPIVTALELIRLRGTGKPSKPHEIIARQVSHLTRLVDDLLDISKITRGKVHLDKHPVRLAAIVANAVEIASPLFEQRRHHLTVTVTDDDLWLEADALRMAQVIANLLTNAAKYTDPGGTVALTARREGDDAVVEVRDNGKGLARELLPQIFDLFVQGVQGPERAEGGLGIGLALVKNLVTMHGGTVEAHSEGPGRGSEFVVRVPALPAGSRD
jgi:PAS domain S-box-containing protein